MSRESRIAAINTVVDGRPIYDQDGLLGGIGAENWTLQPLRYLLVEKSRYDGELYLTTWDGPADAADYHDNQECPEDWNVESLVDLDTGLALNPTTTTTFGGT